MGLAERNERQRKNMEAERSACASGRECIRCGDPLLSASAFLSAKPLPPCSWDGCDSWAACLSGVNRIGRPKGRWDWPKETKDSERTRKPDGTHAHRVGDASGAEIPFFRPLRFFRQNRCRLVRGMGVIRGQLLFGGGRAVHGLVELVPHRVEAQPPTPQPRSGRCRGKASGVPGSGSIHPPADGSRPGRRTTGRGRCRCH